MIPVFSQKDAFALDKATITSNYLSEEELMDNAGRSIAQFIVENIHNPFHHKNHSKRQWLQVILLFYIF